MNITTDIKPISYLKAHSAEVLEQINTTRSPMVITQNGEPRAVLQDPASYDAMRKAIGLLKILCMGEEDVRQGRVKPQEEVFAGVESLLESKSK